jgi:hypothetical protein
MRNKSKAPRKTPTAEQIAEMATQGEDVSRFFTNNFTIVRPVRRSGKKATGGADPATGRAAVTEGDRK